MVLSPSPTGACGRQLVGRRRDSLSIATATKYLLTRAAPGHFFISSGAQNLQLPAPPKYRSTSRKILLPILCAFLMPGISLLNTNIYSNGVEPRRIISSWLSGFLFLLLLWAVDQWIADRFNRSRRSLPVEGPAKPRAALRFTIQTVINLTLIIGFIRLIDLLDFHLNANTSPVLSFIKLALASLVILSIQATLASL